MVHKNLDHMKITFRYINPEMWCTMFMNFSLKKFFLICSWEKVPNVYEFGGEKNAKSVHEFDQSILINIRCIMNGHNTKEVFTLIDMTFPRQGCDWFDPL